MTSPTEMSADLTLHAEKEPSGMARVRPFAAYRYATPNRDISAFTAPPYDVISPEERTALLRSDERNVVALELPSGPADAACPDSRYEAGAATWASWREQGIVTRDSEPSVYALEQIARLEGVFARRRAFVLEVALEPFSAGVVLPHERMLPEAFGDRLELIRTTRANFSQVLGLFNDAENESGRLFDAVATGDPICTATDADGVESRLWKSSSPEIAAHVSTLLATKQIFIADGHHRYATALAYRDERRRAARSLGEDPVDPAYDFVMMALANMDDPGLIVMPTHRVADAEQPLNAEAFWASLGKHFDVTVPSMSSPVSALEKSDRPAFVIKTRFDLEPRLATLRADIDLDTEISADRSSAWKRLDVAVLQELILGPLLGIRPDEPETLDRLHFLKDAQNALQQTALHDVAFVLRPTRMDQLRAVALASETMPQKSTYFYPKLLSGLLFRSAE